MHTHTHTHTHTHINIYLYWRRKYLSFPLPRSRFSRRPTRMAWAGWRWKHTGGHLFQVGTGWGAFCLTLFFPSIDSEDGERGVTFRVGKFIGQVSIESGWTSGEAFSSGAKTFPRCQVPASALVVPPDLPADVHHRALHLPAHRQQGQQPGGPRLQDEGDRPASEGDPPDWWVGGMPL